MIVPQFDWILPEPIQPPPALTGFSAAASTLLVRRGLTTDAQVSRFLSAGAADLHPVTLMTDADAALDRLERALDAGERMAVWGDYDADGMTAAAIWVLALRALGANPIAHLPSRESDGYGLSLPGLRALAEQGVTLVVTCDCGVGNRDEIAEARRMGIEVIVTDHHLPPAVLPPAVAVVDPHRPGDAYPDKDLTGAGVAWKLAGALLGRRGSGVAGLAALAAIGTIADMAPLTGECRAIVRLGLAELAETTRPGLRALVARAADDPAAPTARDIGFGIVPRLNAAGRIADAALALDLLLAEREDEAVILSEALETIHRQRQALTVTAMGEADALAAVAPASTPLALRHDEWPIGLVGLIAGRLSDRLGRPVAVAAAAGEELRGSVRAPADFHVADALGAVGEHLLAGGGHAGAGGFSLRAADWAAFAAAFERLPRPFPPGTTAAVTGPNRLPIDLVLPADLVTWSLLAEFDRMAPYGAGHPEPVLAVHGLRVGDARRMGATGNHLRMRLLRGAETIDAMAFGTGEIALPAEGDRLDVAATLEQDTFGGLPRLRLRLIDWATPDHSPLAARRRPAAGATTP